MFKMHIKKVVFVVHRRISCLFLHLKCAEIMCLGIYIFWLTGLGYWFAWALQLCRPNSPLKVIQSSSRKTTLGSSTFYRCLLHPFQTSFGLENQPSKSPNFLIVEMANQSNRSNLIDCGFCSVRFDLIGLLHGRNLKLVAFLSKEAR